MKTVDDIKRDYQAAVDSLFTAHNGRRTPRYSEEIHNAKMAEYRGIFNESLDTLMQIASERQEKAQAVIDKVGNPYAVLSTDDLQRAALLAPFVAADVSQQDAPGMVEAVQNAAAWGDNAVAWLVGREVEKRFPEDAGPTAQAQINGALREIEKSLDPERYQELSDAKLELFESQRDYNEAEQAGDAWKANIAVTYGVNAKLVPG